MLMTESESVASAWKSWTGTATQGRSENVTERLLEEPAEKARWPLRKRLGESEGQKELCFLGRKQKCSNCPISA